MAASVATEPETKEFAGVGARIYRTHESTALSVTVGIALARRLCVYTGLGASSAAAKCGVDTLPATSSVYAGPYLPVRRHPSRALSTESPLRTSTIPCITCGEPESDRHAPAHVAGQKI